MRTNLKKWAFAAAVLPASIMYSAAAHSVTITSGSLGVTTGYPDLQAYTPEMDYTANGSGFSLTITDGGYGGQVSTGSEISDITYLSGLTFDIFGDVTGSETSNFNLSVTDSVSGDTLSSSTLTGLSKDSTSLEFLFDSVSGTGTLGSLFGSTVGIIFSSSSFANFDLTGALDSPISGELDMYPQSVSEPGTLGLLLLGFSSMLYANRKKQSN